MRMRTSFSILALAALAGPALAQKLPDRLPSVPIEGRDVVVITGIVPVPNVGEGAPLFTLNDVEAIAKTARDASAQAQHDMRRCAGAAAARTYYARGAPTLVNLLAEEQERADRASNLAPQAVAATQAAEDARRGAAAGKVSQAEVEATELKRQDAVNKLETARQKLREAQAMTADYQKLSLSGVKDIDWGLLDTYALNRTRAGWGFGLAKVVTPEGLQLVGVNAEKRQDKHGAYVAMFGKIQNNGAKPMRVPDLTGSVLDVSGWALATTTVSPDARKQIPPGGVYPFGFELRPAPDGLQKAVVTFKSEEAPPTRLGVGQFCTQPNGPPAMGRRPLQP